MREDCNEDSSETSSGCKTKIDRSCGCASEEEKSIECMTLCSSDEKNTPCNPELNDCSTSNTSSPTDDLTIEFIRKRGTIQDDQRQIKRPAKMRATSVAIDVFRSKMPRRQSRFATKKLYNSLVSKLPHSKVEVQVEKSAKIAEYVLKRPLSSLKEVGSWKRREQQE